MSTSSVRLPSQNQLILADAHVHIYPCFDLTDFLESALLNFQAYHQASESAPDFTSVLFLTETRNENYFRELKQIGRSQGNAQALLPDWTIATTDEDCSLYARSPDSRGAYVLAGRQLVTAENLEVLALATTEDLQDGLPLEATIREVADRGGIPVIPWGFGKWFGRRGKLLADLLNEEQLPTLFLGDNGGRPAFWSRPPLFARAERQGLRILPGTDPLPFASQSHRPGKFGFALTGFGEQFNRRVDSLRGHGILGYRTFQGFILLRERPVCQAHTKNPRIPFRLHDKGVLC